MAKSYRNTFKAQAYAMTSLGDVLAQLGHDHRVAASRLERRTDAQHAEAFEDWIALLSEASAATERLLALEIELARRHGMTWEAVASVLGTSRQAAWERFGSHDRWNRTHRLSRLRRQHRARLVRRMAAGQDTATCETLKRMMSVDQILHESP